MANAWHVLSAARAFLSAPTCKSSVRLVRLLVKFGKLRSLSNEKNVTFTPIVAAMNNLPAGVSAALSNGLTANDQNSASLQHMQLA